jgi:hypothetical protein
VQLAQRYHEGKFIKMIYLISISMISTFFVHVNDNRKIKYIDIDK